MRLLEREAERLRRLAVVRAEMAASKVPEKTVPLSEYLALAEKYERAVYAAEIAFHAFIDHGFQPALAAPPKPSKRDAETALDDVLRESRHSDIIDGRRPR